jgi:conjugal transfer pilus assembly protein TraW
VCARSLVGSASAILALLLASGAAQAVDVTLGQTFTIAEPDVLREIKGAAAARDWQSWMRKQPKDYSAFDSVQLPRNRIDQSRLFDPTYVLPRDIRDDTGKLIAPAGARVNVYAKRKRVGRYIVIGGTAADYRWLDEVAKPTDQDRILLANANVFLERRSSKRQLYLLDAHFAERLGVKGVPSIIEQEGVMLRVREYAIR